MGKRFFETQNHLRKACGIRKDKKLMHIQDMIERKIGSLSYEKELKTFNY